MRVRLDATPEELRTKGPALLKSLGKSLSEHAPELAEALNKAAELPPKESVLKHKVLRQLHTQLSGRYSRQMDKMNQEIADLLDSNLQKSEDYTQKISDADAAAFDQVRTALYELNYLPADFEEGGVLYGASTNELLELAHAGRRRDED